MQLVPAPRNQTCDMKRHADSNGPLDVRLKDGTPIVIRRASSRDADDLARLVQALVSEGLWTVRDPRGAGLGGRRTETDRVL